MTEVRVVYRDGEHGLRCLKGVVASEDSEFLTIERRDGRVRISKRVIERIEEWDESRETEAP